MRTIGKPFEKGNPGRKVGSKNIINVTVKGAVLEVFNIIKDDPEHGLLKFAQTYPKEFYAIASKLISVEMAVKVDAEIRVITGMTVI